ncbi:hypothetical protein E2C01_042741 [Portunus trituberculatus]|uniref:Uncharacterized protein n=1 Tax=Portunus trituberculatus TaxID=210409 RepID=A0A5B7FXC0_PORTR|nr:hypothetical protein [Portunus trituberculatus]
MSWWWVTDSVKLPYLIMVGFICTGLVLFCVCFCIDLKVNSSKVRVAMREENRAMGDAVT